MIATDSRTLFTPLLIGSFEAATPPLRRETTRDPPLGVVTHYLNTRFLPAATYLDRFFY